MTDMALAPAYPMPPKEYLAMKNRKMDVPPRKQVTPPAETRRNTPVHVQKRTITQ